MERMFQLCKELEFIDLSNFDNSNVTNMAFMFNECTNLKEIKGINKFVTNKVTNMEGMFQLCTNLKDLDLSNFNTEKVTNMIKIFEGLKMNIKIKTKDQNLLNLINKK
jgi:surface protein